MEKVKICIFVFVFLLLSFSAFAAQINSTGYKQNVIVSVGGESVNSSSYKTSLAIGIINRVINSTSYINRLGFFYTWKLANEQPCTSADQCEGNFCCSNNYIRRFFIIEKIQYGLLVRQVQFYFRSSYQIGVTICP